MSKNAPGYPDGARIEDKDAWRAGAVCMMLRISCLCASFSRFVRAQNSLPLPSGIHRATPVVDKFWCTAVTPAKRQNRRGDIQFARRSCCQRRGCCPVASVAPSGIHSALCAAALRGCCTAMGEVIRFGIKRQGNTLRILLSSAGSSPALNSVR